MVRCSVFSVQYSFGFVWFLWGFIFLFVMFVVDHILNEHGAKSQTKTCGQLFVALPKLDFAASKSFVYKQNINKGDRRKRKTEEKCTTL